jgi:rSAM/selenodomain-associated transferase 1
MNDTVETAQSSCLVLFTKPARVGKVKTRLIGELTPEQATALHRCFVGDLTDRLMRGRFELRIAWAMPADEPLPSSPVAGMRQVGRDLGERLFAGLSRVAAEHDPVAAIGSDHPEIALSLVSRAFDKLKQGTDVVLGPAADGGYYLIAVARGALRREIFDNIPWSSPAVLNTTLQRCHDQNLAVELLPQGDDVDDADDLIRLTARLRRDRNLECPRTRALLESWGKL